MSATLQIARGHDRRLRAGHCWVYSNEVDTAATPLAEFAPGDPVEIVGERGRWLGSGYVNPHSLICARLVSRDRVHPLDRSLLVHRLNIALALRERLYAQPYYRLVYGESDGLPGLVVDRFGSVLVVQLSTAGMERLRDDVVAALDKVLRPSGVLLRNDSPVRAMEGLPAYVETAAGEVPDTLLVSEGESVFETAPATGQKTGWYFDQAANRDRLLRYVPGLRVLDVCSYVGAWGVRAAGAGAAAVTCVDASAGALAGALANAARNGVAERVGTREGDAFEVLRELRAAGERYDVVILDPPAFVKRRKDLAEGSLAYRRLNELGLTLLARDGLLVTSSCSFHMARDELLRTVQQAARHADRSLQLLEEGRQGPDHPVHPAMPETAYLKTFYLRVLPTF
jgi:23S rRNA (cytosine1962-C5)-methyltransferase